MRIFFVLRRFPLFLSLLIPSVSRDEDAQRLSIILLCGGDR
jgi:hypothetical protein